MTIGMLISVIYLVGGWVSEIQQLCETDIEEEDKEAKAWDDVHGGIGQ